MNIPSILNDVIGPVMRGPSSSHSAAAVRIGRICRDLLQGRVETVDISFDTSGSLPTTYLGQGSDMGLCGGLLGFAADDERLVDYKAELVKAGIAVTYHTGNYGDPHPNTYNLRIAGGGEEHDVVAISTGGGMIEVQKIDGLELSYFGDCYGLTVWSDGDAAEAAGMLMGECSTITRPGPDSAAPLFVTRSLPFSPELLEQLAAGPGIIGFRTVAPVLPILTTPETAVPFTTAAEMLSYSAQSGMVDLGELALEYEAARGNITGEEVLEKALRLVDILDDSVKDGLQGTTAADRILGFQSGAYVEKRQQNELFDLGLLNHCIPYITALMEVKSSLGVIVAAPTAGSCGALPGTVLAAADTLQMGREAKARGLLAAGLVGALIATRSTFAAEVCGCQAECGVASGMTAAAMVSMYGGDCSTSLCAASIALQNIFGMVCDPVAKRVEVPCLGKNILAASNGISCANLALAGYDPVIPFDEVVAAMDSVGRALPHELRCTGRGGLAVTPTALKIEKELG